MKKKILWALAAGVISAALIGLGGCSKRTSGEETGSEVTVESSSEESKETTGAETTESTEETENLKPEESLEATETLVQQKIVTATDIHYLAEEFSGNRCESFMSYVKSGDGQVLQYSWEVLDAFIEDMLSESPDLVILSGDLTLNGEKKSHEELAEKLQVLTKADIPVIVIPGNHDINNHLAQRFTTDGSEKVDSVTAEEFAEIYAEYGYDEAESRDPASLSYVYILDDYYRILMLDSCQYDPRNLVGGHITRETYDWIDEKLDEAWEEGAQIISVSHHNLLDQSGVSRDFYDNCTIEHNEELVERLENIEVRLHLSGHLHLQHYMGNDSDGIQEVITGSLVMAPCRYGVVSIMDSGDYIYQAKTTDVEGWAKTHGYKNKDLLYFSSFSENFLRQVTYKNAVLDLRKYTADGKLHLSDERIEEMARFYAELCVHYYGGRMFKIADTMRTEKAFEYWNNVEYVSDLSDFLKNILEDDAKDFSYLEIPY